MSVRTSQDESTHCSRCGGVLNPHKAIVAFSVVADGAVVLRGTDHLVCDMRQAGVDASDVWTGKDVPEHGIWVWEGEIVYTDASSDLSVPLEIDVEYVGTWRGLTSEEWGELGASITWESWELALR